MSESDGFSLKPMIITGLVSFFISGLGGYLLSDWQNRAKPALIVSSIGFSPSDRLLEIEPNLLARSLSSSWMRRLKKFEPYSSVDEEYKRLVRIEKRLQKGVDLAEKWLKEKEKWKTGAIEKISVQEIAETPYAQDSIVGSTLVGSIRRNEVDNPPVSFEELKSLSDVAELFKDDEGWRIHLGSKSTGFPDDDAKGHRSKNHIKLLAFSFAKGSTKNIYYYTKWFVDETYRDLQDVQSLIANIKNILLPSAHLKIDVSVYNSGHSPVTLKPYMAVKFLNEELKNHSIILHRAKEQTNETSSLGDLFGLKNGQNEKSTDVKVSSYLPESIGSQYIFIPPNSGENFTLSSNTPLGVDKGAKILALFNANALRSQLISLDSDGVSINSPAFIFGKNISKDDEVLINNAANSR